MIAALHPVIALLILTLSVLLVRRATELVRQERGTRTEATASAAR